MHIQQRRRKRRRRKRCIYSSQELAIAIGRSMRDVREHFHLLPSEEGGWFYLALWRKMFLMSCFCFAPSSCGKATCMCTFRSPYVYAFFLKLYEPRFGMPSPGMMISSCGAMTLVRVGGGDRHTARGIRAQTNRNGHQPAPRST